MIILTIQVVHIEISGRQYITKSICNDIKLLDVSLFFCENIASALLLEVRSHTKFTPSCTINKVAICVRDINYYTISECQFMYILQETLAMVIYLSHNN